MSSYYARVKIITIGLDSDDSHEDHGEEEAGEEGHEGHNHRMRFQSRFMKEDEEVGHEGIMQEKFLLQ